MWPTTRSYGNPVNPAANPPQQSSQAVNKSLASVDSNQLRMAADSLRTLFGDNISSNLLSSIGNSSKDRMDTSLQQMASRRPPEMNALDYESPNYSRLDRTRLSQMSSDFGSNDKRFNDSPPLMTESRIYDPTKMPQKSILKKSRDQSFENNTFRSVEEEDLYIYGNPNPSSGPSGTLPPGIVTLEQTNERSPPNERSLSPISLRLKREMEKMDRTRRQAEPNDDIHWTPRLGLSAEEPIRINDWNEEEEVFKRRYLMNPSPERSLELEKVRIQQMAAIQAGILTHKDNTTKRRELSPNSPQRHSDYSSYRRSSPELSPKRVRRRSPSISPRRRRSISPRRRSRSPRKRSISPRSRRGYQSRSRSRERYRRSRSRTPPRRRSPNPAPTQMNLMNPINPMGVRMPVQGMPFMPLHHNIVGLPMGPIMSQYMAAPPHPMAASFPRPFPRQPNILPKQMPALKPSGAQSSPKKTVEKKEDKLLNPHDLLVAERQKLRDELEGLKKELQRKKEDQEVVVKKDGGNTDSYVFRHLDKEIKSLKNAIETKHEKLIKNFELINEVQKSKSKAKAVMEQLKTSRDITKVELKKKESPPKKKSNDWPSPKKKSPDKKSAKEKPKQDNKEEIDEDEEDEKSSRFHYFDSGPHWCKDCNKFLDNMKLYFTHIHSKEHLAKHKDCPKTPWITKGYIKEMERQEPKNKDQLVVASKGINFILPTHGFFCELCDQFLHDSYLAEKHFKSAKHNRSYTRYTLLHNEYEHKWKAERDRAFTEMKKKEREVEKERSNKEFEKRVEERKRLEDEVKRKDREVKERIDAMNKSLKTVKELDDPKAVEQKKEDKSKSSPKSYIRLNLSLSKSSPESKSSEKSSDKSRDKTKDKSKEKSEQKANKSPKSGESMDTSEGIEDMLVIDEINCESEDNSGTQESTENTAEAENELLFPKNSETDPKSDEIKENENKANEEITENVIEIMDTSGEESKQMAEEKSDSSVNKTQTGDKNENTEQIEGVIPAITENSDTNVMTTQVIRVTEQESEDNPQSSGVSDPKPDSEDKSSDGMVSKTEDIHKTESTDPSNGCDASHPMTYAEALAKGAQDLKPEIKDIKPIKLEVKSESLEYSGSVVKEEPENGNNSQLFDKKGIKNEKLIDIDFDIESFNERLKNLDSMVKKDSTETDVDEEDPLDGFDVIDETNNEDNSGPQEVIDLSD